MAKKAILVMDVDDEFGVLTRITGRIRREGVNIDALSVAQTATPGISRMTICIETRTVPFEQIINRLTKFDCVKNIFLCDEEKKPVRELLLVRCPANSSLHQGESIIEQNGDTVTFEKTGTPQEIDTYLKDHHSQISEFSRSGAVTVETGGVKHAGF